MTALAGVLRLGFVADLLSKPTMIGYMNGLALTILVGQLPKLFGFSVEADSFIAELRGFAKGSASRRQCPPRSAIGLFGLALICPLPALVAEGSGRAGSSRPVYPGRQGLRPGRSRGFVGGQPTSRVPPLTIPHVPLSDFGLLIGGAFGIAVVSLADTISTASSFVARSGEEIDGSREMIGIGAANIAAGLFQGFPVSTSGSRTAVAEQAGAKTQVTGLVGALAITVMLLIAPGLLRNLPQPTLAAVVIAAAMSLADVDGTVRLFRQRRAEFSLSIAAFLGVTLFGVLIGIAIAVALSVSNVFRRQWWPYHTTLARVPGLAGYHDVHSYHEAESLLGCVIFRFDAPLIFANARTFREHIRALAGTDPPPAWIIVAAEPITDVDTTAADMLEDLDQALNQRGINLVFAEMKDPVRRKIDRYGLTRTLDPAHFFPTIDDVIAAFRTRFGTDWTPSPAEPPT